MRIIACVEDPEVIEKNLTHLDASGAATVATGTWRKACRRTRRRCGSGRLDTAQAQDGRREGLSDEKLPPLHPDSRSRTDITRPPIELECTEYGLHTSSIRK